MNLTRWKNEQEGSLSKLESKLKDANIKETKARKAKEFLSVQLALKNVNNISHIEKIRSLEAEIEKREASEELKLALLNRQKEALGLLGKRAREMRSRKSSGALMEKRIEDILSRYSTKLETRGRRRDEINTRYSGPGVQPGPPCKNCGRFKRLREEMKAPCRGNGVLLHNQPLLHQENGGWLLPMGG